MIRLPRPLILSLLLIALPACAAAPPRRIVSLSLCADQLVLALADRSQIAALTPYARDPKLSYFVGQAELVPTVARGVEAILMLRPDVVIDAPFGQRQLLAPLAAKGTRLIDVPDGHDLAGIELSIRQVAVAVGHPERGAALIARMRAELAQAGPPPGRGRVAAYYQRQGYLTGTGTLVDDMMRRAGLVNLAGRLGKPALSRVSLEEMAMARPNFLVMEEGTRRVADRGTEMLHHPLLATIVPPARQIYLPQSLTVCGGPGYPRAVKLLVDAIRRTDVAGR